MIEGNATMDVSSFVSEMIMPITATVNIVDAEIIAGKHDNLCRLHIQNMDGS